MKLTMSPSEGLYASRDVFAQMLQNGLFLDCLQRGPDLKNRAKDLASVPFSIAGIGAKTALGVGATMGWKTVKSAGKVAANIPLPVPSVAA